jgi:hypothetical protein
MEQIDATIMCEAGVPKSYREFSWSFWHYNESYLSGSFHCNAENPALLRHNRLGRELSC